MAERFDLSGRVYLLELDLERLFLAVPERIRQSQPIPRYPPAQRDLACGGRRRLPPIAEVIRASGGALVRDVRLFDVYTGEGIPAGKKSLA